MKITISKSKWLGATYNVAEMYLNSWSVSDNQDTWDTLEQWCEEQFGPKGDPWTLEVARWYYNDGKMFFKNDSDLSLFLLRWS